MLHAIGNPFIYQYWTERASAKKLFSLAYLCQYWKVSRLTWSQPRNHLCFCLPPPRRSSPLLRNTVQPLQGRSRPCPKHLLRLPVLLGRVLGQIVHVMFARLCATTPAQHCKRNKMIRHQPAMLLPLPTAVVGSSVPLPMLL